MTAPPPLLIAHLSDLHLDGGPESWSRAAAVLTHLRSARTPLDAIVITGDITDGNSTAVDAQISNLLEALPASVPLICCSGNTDDASSIRKIRRHPAASMTTGEIDIVPIDCEPGAPARLQQESLAQARAQVMALTGDDRALIAIHHPPAPLHDSVGDQLLLQEIDELTELVDHPAVIAVLAGHTHSATHGSFLGTPLIIAPGVRSEGRLPHVEVSDYGDALIDDRSNPAYLLHRIQGRIITSYARQAPSMPRDPIRPDQNHGT